MDRFVYLDNASTTKVSEHVLESMLPFLRENYGNPSNIYQLATVSKKALEDARAKVAMALGCDADEVFFTSCGTEADNWAIKGAAGRLRAKGKNHIVTSVFEHHAVLHTAQYLEKEGFEVSYVPVDADGFVNPDDVRAAIRESTAVVSVMYANNEIGTIQPVAEIGAVCQEAGVWFHTDAVQAVGNVEIDVRRDKIDMLALSGHKINAPKGVGALYVRKGIRLDTFMEGGGQESGKRAGTENVAGIVALGTAIEDASKDIDKKTAYLKTLREAYLDEMLALEGVRLNGGRENRLAGNANISIEGIEGESMLLRLSFAGISASSGSACTSGSLDPSHVLLSIGLAHEIAHGSLRTTFSTDNTLDDVRYVCGQLTTIIGQLREMSPIWEARKSKS
ncbi:MAG: cysteine desulfurase NifS [Oscillospiraceae bacterium]|nr:cysteine desulfurase NifS [Oscillospiraceae bacterium]